MLDNSDKSLFFNYHFHFDDGKEEKFIIKLENLDYIRLVKNSLPNWTELEYKKCKNCILNSDNHPHCPVAVSLADIIPQFSNIISYQQVLVKVETRDRIYKKMTTVHQALSSLLGILMVTSNCPTMKILRPMVRFHLPFATVEETIIRSVSSFLLAQYFRNKNGLEPDINLTGLLKAYKDIQIVNVGMANRLSSISKEDANINAIVLLDILAKELPDTIVEQLKEIEYLYV